jgi:4-oxalocrotonate tautomerase
MPLARISLRRGKSTAYLPAIRDGIYDALRDTFNVPEDDRVMLVTQHDAEEFDYSPRYMGIARSDDLVIIQITVSNTRTVAQKQALYKRIVERLTDNPGLRPEDVFISLVEVQPADWSFGLVRAQYVEAGG